MIGYNLIVKAPQFLRCLFELYLLLKSYIKNAKEANFMSKTWVNAFFMGHPTHIKHKTFIIYFHYFISIRDVPLA